MWRAQRLHIWALFSLAYVAAILFAHRGKARHASGLTEFFVSGRDLGLGTAIATLGATEIGLITIAYNAQKGFNEGFSAFHIGLAALVGCVFVGALGFVVKPIRRTGVLTLPEYYEQRYGRDIRVFGAIVMAMGGILNMGLFLKVASVFLAAMLAANGAEVNVNALMITLIGVAVLYTCYGGMRSVIITDVFPVRPAGGRTAVRGVLPYPPDSTRSGCFACEGAQGYRRLRPLRQRKFRPELRSVDGARRRRGFGGDLADGALSRAVHRKRGDGSARLSHFQRDFSFPDGHPGVSRRAGILLLQHPGRSAAASCSPATAAMRIWSRLH